MLGAMLTSKFIYFYLILIHCEGRFSGHAMYKDGRLHFKFAFNKVMNVFVLFCTAIIPARRETSGSVTGVGLHFNGCVRLAVACTGPRSRSG
jgi:hypothetical protein